jgi:uncharacterized RDD family membrane protein YckC
MKKAEAVPTPMFEDSPRQTGIVYMGFWIRVLAITIDTILMGIVDAILATIIGMPLLGLLVAYAYYVIFTGLRGQTLGKMVMRIHVVDANGNVPGLGRAALREIVGKMVSGLAILIGYFWVGWDRQKRGWHDHIAGTYVIHQEPERDS